jgi:hypothetical protein
MQDDRPDSAGRAAAILSSTTTAEVGIDIGALRADNLKGVGRVYQQTFIDAYAGARPLPSQALRVRPAEATAPLPQACAG